MTLTLELQYQAQRCDQPTPRAIQVAVQLLRAPEQLDAVSLPEAGTKASPRAGSQAGYQAVAKAHVARVPVDRVAAAALAR